MKTYWIKNAQYKWDAAESLYQNGKYADALFFYHLSIESMLKGIVVTVINEPAPFIHDLERLAEIAGLEVTEEQRKILIEITKFNMAGRYPDDKFEFYHIATKEFAGKARKRIQEIKLWLEQQTT